MNHEPNVLSNGTTIMAVTCSDGVVLAADSRATTGAFVAIRDINKITDITPNIYVCHSGSAADTQALATYAKYYYNVMKLYSDQDVSVFTIAQILRKLVQSNKAYLQAQMIVAGVDSTGPSVHMVMQSGCSLKRDFAAGGSGSTYITSYCDQFYNTGMNVEDASKFALRAINHATIRDGYSGGPINIVQITKDGAKRKWFKPQDQPLDYTIVKT